MSGILLAPVIQPDGRILLGDIRSLEGSARAQPDPLLP